MDLSPAACMLRNVTDVVPSKGEITDEKNRSLAAGSARDGLRRIHRFLR